MRLVHCDVVGGDVASFDRWSCRSACLFRLCLWSGTADYGTTVSRPVLSLAVALSTAAFATLPTFVSATAPTTAVTSSCCVAAKFGSIAAPFTALPAHVAVPAAPARRVPILFVRQLAHSLIKVAADRATVRRNRVPMGVPLLLVLCRVIRPALLYLVLLVLCLAMTSLCGLPVPVAGADGPVLSPALTAIDSSAPASAA